MIDNYMNKHFPEIKSLSTMYEQAQYKVHLSLGNGIYQFDENGKLNRIRFKIAFQEALSIFNHLFNKDDDLLIVTHVYTSTKSEYKKLNVYKHNVKNKELLNRLKVKTKAYPYEYDNEDTYETQEFSLACRVKDIDIKNLLKATLHEDFPLKPSFSKHFIQYPDVFFINMTKHLIYFLYDDRGCEIITGDKEILQDVKNKYAHLIDEFKK